MTCHTNTKKAVQTAPSLSDRLPPIGHAGASRDRRVTMSVMDDAKTCSNEDTKRRSWDVSQNNDNRNGSKRSSVTALSKLNRRGHWRYDGLGVGINEPGVWGVMRINLEPIQAGDVNDIDMPLVTSFTDIQSRNNSLTTDNNNDNSITTAHNVVKMGVDIHSGGTSIAVDQSVVTMVTKSKYDAATNFINRLSKPKSRDMDKSGGSEQNDLVRKPSRVARSTGVEILYLTKIREIIYETYVERDRPSPTKILDYLYIGSYVDANNPQYLQRLGITHVLNCAAGQSHPDRCPYNPDTGILWYQGIPAVDKDSYDIVQHVDTASSFIMKAWTDGKILVHCKMGVNRSVFLVACYLIDVLRMTLLDAVKMLKQTRVTILCNTGFQKRLVGFAKRKGQL